MSTNHTDVPPLSDRELVTRIARGDRDALTHLRRRYETTIYAEAYRIIRDTLESEHVVEQVFAQLWFLAHWLQSTSASGGVARWMLDQARAAARAMLLTSGIRSPLTMPPSQPQGARSFIV